jgi:hypothetical protein
MHSETLNIPTDLVVKFFNLFFLFLILTPVFSITIRFISVASV